MMSCARAGRESRFSPVPVFRNDARASERERRVDGRRRGSVREDAKATTALEDGGELVAEINTAVCALGHWCLWNASTDPHRSPTVALHSPDAISRLAAVLG